MPLRSLRFSQCLKTSLTVREVMSSITRAGQIDSPGRQPLAIAATVLGSCFAQASSRGDGPRYSFHASASYREHNEGLLANVSFTQTLFKQDVCVIT